jgi:hypothetical protein
MTINNKPHRSIATLKLPRKVPDLINLALVIVKAMTGNTNFRLSIRFGGSAGRCALAAG